MTGLYEGEPGELTGLYEGEPGELTGLYEGEPGEGGIWEPDIPGVVPCSEPGNCQGIIVELGGTLAIPLFST